MTDQQSVDTPAPEKGRAIRYFSEEQVAAAVAAEREMCAREAGKYGFCEIGIRVSEQIGAAIRAWTASLDAKLSGVQPEVLKAAVAAAVAAEREMCAKLADKAAEELMALGEAMTKAGIPDTHRLGKAGYQLRSLTASDVGRNIRARTTDGL